jgi:PAS domain S-box-containing protein
MAEPLRVLLVEDSEDDALLLLRELRRAGLEPAHQRVDSEQALLAALARQTWDLVLSDYAMGAFNGLAAFELVKGKGLDLPFIFVSGHIGEERAAEAMKHGANDYVLKDNLTRLIPAIRREMKDAEVRRERARMERTLEERERQLSSIYNTVGDVIYQLEVEPDGRYRFTSVNQTFLSVTGLTMDQVVGRRVDEVIPEPSLNLVLGKYAEAIRDRKIVRWEETSDYPTGRLTGEISVAPIFDDAGNCTHLVGAVHDITARKRAEDELAASQRLLQTVFDSLPHNLVVKDTEHRYLMVNRAWCQVHGISPEQALGRHTLDIPGRRDEDKRRTFEEDSEVLAARASGVYQRVVTVGGGEPRHVHVIRTPLRGDQGQVEGLVNISVDLTTEIEARHKADVAYARLYDAIESLPAAFLLFDAEQRLVVWNSRVRDLLPHLYGRLAPGVLYEDILRGEAEQVEHGPNGQEFRLRELRTRLRGVAGAAEVRHKDGRWVQMLEKRTSEEGIVALRFDITELKQREQELRQAQKMEALGQLTGGVAHDFNNLLQIISSYTAFSLEGLAAEERRHQDLTTVMHAVERAAALTQQLLAFSRRQVLRPASLDLNEVVAGHLKMLRRVLPESIELEERLAPALDTVRADRGMVEQVLLNLVINARDALPSGGRIALATFHSELSAEDCPRAPWAEPGRYVSLACVDTGEGMAPEVLERIFEPFFTTKGQGKGTGLGLSTVYGIVEQHRGVIGVESEPGVGTTFRIHLPVRNNHEQAAAAVERAPLLRGEGTILVAEDADELRQLAVRVLEAQGYRVLAAADGEQALELFAAHKDEIDLVVLDVMMPKLSGTEAYRRMQGLKPGIRAVFSSGWYDEADETLARIEGARLLYKPHPAGELLRAVQELLREPGAN